MELAQRRLGYRSARTLMLTDAEKIYGDQILKGEVDDFCDTIQISTIRSANRGATRDPEDLIRPAQCIFLDVQPNPSRQDLVSKDYVANYLTVCDAYSRFFRLMDLPDTSTKGVTQALKEFFTAWKPYPEFQLKDVDEIHVDAGSQLMSEKMNHWCISHGITLVIAAPHHQEMNGLRERMWQACRKTAFSMNN